MALALEGVEERPHMERSAFRTKRKIFATLGDDRRVNIVIEPHERREALMRAHPDVFFSSAAGRVSDTSRSSSRGWTTRS